MPARVDVYTRQWCGYCTAAKRFLDKRGVRYTEIDCTGDADKRRWLAQASGQSTVPQIFIDERPIGGFTDMRDLADAGELDALLAGQAPATTS
jgi:glutaredoxin 3